eukprot:7380407-Prymnesium_polylepis.1
MSPSCGRGRVSRARAGLRLAGPDGGRSEWALCAGQLPEYTFTSVEAEAGEDGLRPFSCMLEWIDAFTPGCKLRFPTVVGLAHGLESDSEVRSRT